VDELLFACFFFCFFCDFLSCFRFGYSLFFYRMTGGSQSALLIEFIVSTPNAHLP